jgi:hypothetical protein
MTLTGDKSIVHGINIDGPCRTEKQQRYQHGYEVDALHDSPSDTNLPIIGTEIRQIAISGDNPAVKCEYGR